MNQSITGRGILDNLAARFTALLSNLIESLFGARVHTPVVGNIAWVDLGVLLIFVLLVWLVSGLAVALVRRQIRATGVAPESENWRGEAPRTLGGPIRLLIWIYGLYFAATPVLLKLPVEEDPHLVRQLFAKLYDVGVFIALLWLFLKATHVIEARLKARVAATPGKLDDLVIPHLGRSLRVLGPVMGVIFALPMLDLPQESEGLLAKGSSILIIAAVSYVLFQIVHLGQKVVLTKYDLEVADNLQARTVYTQVQVLSRTAHVIIAIFTAASILMLFEEVRRFGTSILASAGVVGIIIGFAAQRTIANLFAGFQLAMTQPIRHDDVVIVEGEWGRIEEITLTYVVVRIWDERRLIVPLSYFIEKPFQNWTRTSTDILGSVFLWADYTLPIAELRPAVQRIVESCADWDRRFWNLQITDATERAMQLRVLATASDASKAWNLRCEIREKLLAFVQEYHPRSLPRVRAVVDADHASPPTEAASPIPSSRAG